MAGALPDYVMSDYRMTVRFAIFLKVAEACATEPFEKSFLAILIFRRSVRVLYNGHLRWQYSRRFYNETSQPRISGCRIPNFQVRSTFCCRFINFRHRH